jgi:hypothetical protein
MSAGGGYMVTGFTKLIMRDMAAAQDRQIFLSPRNGKAPSGSAQVCNASICPDSLHSDRCLFIDFGCQAPMVSTLTGSSYGIHEYLFIGEYSGAVLSWYRHPDNEASWDYPEWSNAGAFAVSCARNNRDEAHAIYFVNLNDSSYCKAVEGTELAHPFLWVNKLDITNDDSLDLDSLGNYNDPPLNANIGEFAVRMHDFWPKHKDMQIVFVGSSHTAYAIDPVFFSGTPVYNMAFGGSPFVTTVSIIENYLINHCPSIEFIGCDIIPGMMNTPEYFSGMSDLIPNKGFNYDKDHDFWKNGLPANFENLTQLAPRPDLPEFDILGLGKTPCTNWGNANPDIPDPTRINWTIDDSTYKSTFNIVKEVAKSLANKKIHFLMYTTPESPYYRSSGIYGAYGATMETGKAVITQLKALQDSFPGYFHFYDGYLYGNHDYVDSEASDYCHLCTVGAKKFSVRMDSVVHSILGH